MSATVQGGSAHRDAGRTGGKGAMAIGIRDRGVPIYIARLGVWVVLFQLGDSLRVGFRLVGIPFGRVGARGLGG